MLYNYYIIMLIEEIDQNEIYFVSPSVYIRISSAKTIDKTVCTTYRQIKNSEHIFSLNKCNSLLINMFFVIINICSS